MESVIYNNSSKIAYTISNEAEIIRKDLDEFEDDTNSKINKLNIRVELDENKINRDIKSIDEKYDKKYKFLFTLSIINLFITEILCILLLID